MEESNVFKINDDNEIDDDDDDDVKILCIQHAAWSEILTYILMNATFCIISSAVVINDH